ncbi:MAG: AmpD protein [Gammaproteobacteria bacterium]|jgi:AmpD protein
MTALIIDNKGWLQSVEVIPSPNYDARPDNAVVSLIVIHGISLPPGEYGGGNIETFFCNELDPATHGFFESISDLRVSAHCLIERSGQIIQFVSFLNRAWHAGVSNWKGQETCNNFSVGIELEGTDTDLYAPCQYTQLSSLIAAIRNRFPTIGRDDLCGHSDIAPGRKTDPGESFDWSAIKNL